MERKSWKDIKVGGKGSIFVPEVGFTQLRYLKILSPQTGKWLNINITWKTSSLLQSQGQ